MRRRDLIALLGGGVASAWPLGGARAQRPTMPVVGFMHATSAATSQDLVAGFVQGLGQSGYVVGKNVAVEYRWANGQYDQLPALAADLVGRNVAAIAVITPVAARAVKKATTSIPIVFGIGSDPVKEGLVANLNRPGGNITGVTFFANLLDAKRAELLHQLAPDAHVVAVLLNPGNTNFELEQKKPARHCKRSDFNRLCFKRATMPASTQLLPVSLSNTPPHYSSVAMLFSAPGGRNSPIWR